MNKFDLINKVLTSTLKADDKNLLIELIVRTDYERHGNWDCWPSVQRLAQVRGMRNERHFKGVDVYLPGLASKRKAGRKNVYTIAPAAIMALPTFEVTVKHTPAVAGVNTPAVEVDTPAVAANTPVVAGANSTHNNTRHSSLEITQQAGSASAPPTPDLIDDSQSEDLRVDKLLVESSDSNTEGIPGRQAAQDALDQWNGMATFPLNSQELTEALSLMLDPRWSPHLRFPQQRAVAAHNEVLSKREMVW